MEHFRSFSLLSAGIGLFPPGQGFSPQKSSGENYYYSVPGKNPAPAQPEVFHAKKLERLRWLIHGFSSRRGGFSSIHGEKTLNLSFTRQDNRATVEQNRSAFLKKLQAVETGEVWPLVTLRQIHSDLIHCIQSVPSTQLVGDGLITATPGLVLAVQTADCLPVILVDPKQKAIGILHAGWRGTVKKIAQKGVGELRRGFGSLPKDLKAAIGPGIHSCCYQVGPEVVQKFASQFAYASELFREVKDADTVRGKYPLLFLTARPPGRSKLPVKLFLDLVEANRRQLLDAGVPAQGIETSPLCTSCRVDLLFSHRAENGVTGRMMGAVGIRQ